MDFSQFQHFFLLRDSLGIEPEKAEKIAELFKAHQSSNRPLRTHTSSYLNGFSIKATLKDLKKIIKEAEEMELSDDTPVLVERIQDHYFNSNHDSGWGVYPISYDFMDELPHIDRINNLELTEDDLKCYNQFIASQQATIYKDPETKDHLILIHVHY